MDDQTLLSQFSEKGYIAPVRLVSKEIALSHQEALTELESVIGVENCRMAHKISSKMIFETPFGLPFVSEIARNPILLDLLQTILDQNLILLNNSSFFIKYGESSSDQTDIKKYIAWHQDLTYMQLTPGEMITAWYAIDDADEENGCLMVVPGSHRQGVREHRMTRDFDNMLNNRQEAKLTPEEQDSAIPVPLKAGESILFSGWLLHGSTPNATPRRRAGLALRFVPTHAACQHPMIKKGILMRGQDHYKHYQLMNHLFAEVV